MLKNKLFFVFIVVLLTSSAVVSVRFVLAKQEWVKPMKDGKEVVAPECPDPSIPGCNSPLNTSETEQYKVGPLIIGGVLQGDSAAIFDDVRVGTSAGLGKLTILGGNMVLMKPNTSHTPGYGLVLHSWSSTMTTAYSNEEELNNAQWKNAKDDCLNVDKNAQFQCAPPQPDGYHCNDVYTKKDSENNTIYYQALATCVGNTSKYSLRANAGNLEFLDNADAARLTLDQNGNLKIGGSLTANQLCLGTDCRTAWPTGGVTSDGQTTISSMDWSKLQNYPTCSKSGQYITGIGKELVCVDPPIINIPEEKDSIIGNEVVGNADNTLITSGAGTNEKPFKLSLNLANPNVWTGSQTFNSETKFGAGITAGDIAVADITANALSINSNVRIANSSKLVLLPGDFGKQVITDWDFGSTQQSDTCDGNKEDQIVCTGYNNVADKDGKPCYDRAAFIGTDQKTKEYATRQIKCVATNGNYALQNIGNSLVFKNGEDKSKFVIGQDGNAIFENKITAKGDISAPNIVVDNKISGKSLDISGDVSWTGSLKGGTVPWANLISFPLSCDEKKNEFVVGIGPSLKCGTVPIPVSVDNSGNVNPSQMAANEGLSVSVDPVSKKITYSITNEGVNSSKIANSSVTNEKISSMDWSKLQNYPTGCSDGKFVTAIGDTITCIAPNPFVETDTLQIISDRGATTSKTLTVAGLSLAGVKDEGNLTNIDALIGYNDLFIKSNSDETAAVHLAGKEIKIWTQGKERMIVDNEGKIGIGTQNPQHKLSVLGSVGLLRDFSTNVVAGPGPEIFLQSPSSEVTGSDTGPAACGGSGQPVCGADTTPDKNLDKFYVCQSSDSGKVYTDIGKIPDSPYTYQTTVSCLAGTSQYSLRTSDGSLQFLNNKSDVKFALSQTGKLDLVGDIAWTGSLTGGTVPWQRLSDVPTKDCGSQFIKSFDGNNLVCGTPEKTDTLAWNKISSFPETCGDNQFVQAVGANGLTCETLEMPKPQSLACSAGQFLSGVGDNLACGTPSAVSYEVDSTLLKMGTNPFKLSLNLANPNVWTANQTFTKNVIVNSNVGIGTVAPNVKLQVSGTQDSLLKLSRDDKTATVFRLGTDGALVVQNQNDDLLTLKNGQVGIGTTEPKAKLDVEGGNIILGGNLGVRGNIDIDGLINLGARITLDEANSSIVLRPKDVGENIYDPQDPTPMGSNKPNASDDTCDKNVDNFSWCDGITAKSKCTDYGKIGGSSLYYKRDVTCFTQANYAIKNEDNSLIFKNGKGESKFVIDQNGNIKIDGSLTANQLCLGGVCRADWPVSGSQIDTDSTLSKTGAGTANDPYKLSLNLVNPNIWTANQTFNGGIINGSSDFVLGTSDSRKQGLKFSNRALAHTDLGIGEDNLIINYEGDFEGGVQISGAKTIIDGKVGIGATDAGNYKLKVAGNAEVNDVYIVSIGKWASELFPDNLVNKVHTVTQCSGLGGEIKTEGSNKFCKFSASSCPGDWKQYNNWSTTVQNSASYKNEVVRAKCIPGCTPSGVSNVEFCGKLTTSKCVIDGHSWSKNVLETKICKGNEAMALGHINEDDWMKCGGAPLLADDSVSCGYTDYERCEGATSVTVSATVTEIGCY